jgi:cobalt/nickel transport system permease protein
MHIPDGFLTPPVWATLDVLAIPAVSLLARKARAEADESRIPLLGVMGAFVFAAQMVNFPVGMGTSGHLLGGTLLACTLGPAAGAMVMTAILAVQALLFQDGGVLALGPNILNMAFVGVYAGYLPVHYFGSRWRRGAIFAGGFLSVLMSASLALSQLLLSGVRIPAAILWVSLGLFAVSAILEGLITVAAVEAIERLHPSWVRQRTAAMRSPAVIALGLAAVFLGAVGVTIASASPDGLERLAEQTGIAEHAKVLLNTPFADYELQAWGSSWLGRALAGLLGVAVVYAIGTAVARAVRLREHRGATGGGA